MEKLNLEFLTLSMVSVIIGVLSIGLVVTKSVFYYSFANTELNVLMLGLFAFIAGIIGFALSKLMGDNKWVNMM